MSACVSFMLLGSSIPLTLQSEVTDPSFCDLTVGRRASSRLSNRASVASQPPRSETPVLEYRRFSGFYEHRRTNSVPVDISSSGTPRTSPRAASGTGRRVRSAPPEGYALPVVHENWIGAEQGRGKRSASEPAKPSRPMSMLDLDQTENRDKNGPNPTPSQKRGSYSLFPSPRSSATPINPSRPPISSTLLPCQPPPALRPKTSASLTSPTFSYDDAQVEGPAAPKRMNSEPSFRPCSRTHSRSRAISHSRSRSLSLSSLFGSTFMSWPDPATTTSSPRNSSSKKVSFSSNDEVIQTDDISIEEITGKTETETGMLRKQSSWNGILLISLPPTAAKPALTRRISMPCTRGQTAGRSILRRTSSFDVSESLQENPVMADSEKPMQVAVRHTSGIGERRNRSPPPPTPLPSLPEDEDDILDSYYEDVDLTTASTASTSTSRLNSDSYPSCSPSSPPQPSSTTTASSPTIPSTSFFLDDEHDINDDTPPIPTITTATQKTMTVSRHTGKDVQVISVPSCSASGKIYMGPVSETPARHWSMQGVDDWVRRSGVFGMAKVDERVRSMGLERVVGRGRVVTVV